MVPVAPFLAIVLSNWSFVPFFDGGYYAQCITLAAAHPSLQTLDCGDHPTIAFVAIPALAVRLTSYSPVALILADALLGCVGCWSLAVAVGRLFPDLPVVERALVAAVAFCSPVLLMSALNPGPDYAMLAFLSVALAGLLTRRRPVAIVGGACASLCKEPGLALFVLMAGAYVLAFRTRNWRDLAAEIRFHLPLLVVPLIFGAHLLLRARAKLPLFWTGALGDRGYDFNPLHVTDPGFVTNMVLAYVVNFTWILAAAALLGGVALVGLVLVRRSSATGWRTSLFLWLLLAGSTYLLTRYRTVTNARYFLPLTALAVLLAVDALRRLVRPSTARLAVLAAFGVIYVLSAYHTFDPVSSRILGTFDAGTEPMLNVDSLTHACCGYGRDQLIYNLQVTGFDYDTDAALRDLRPSMVIVNITEDWYVNRWVERNGTDRALPFTPNSVSSHYSSTEWALQVKPREIWFFSYPNVDTTSDVATLQSVYTVTSVRRYIDHGFALTVYAMRLTR